MPTCLVGQQVVTTSWSEHHVGLLAEGTPVRWWKKDGSSGTGVFEYAWWYDGPIAKITTSGGHVAIIVSCGDRIRRLTNRKS